MKNFTITILTVLSFFIVESTLLAQGFTDVTVAAGIKDPLNPVLPLVHDGDEISDMNVGSGAAWFDFDNDDDLDLYITMRNGANFLYRNNGNNTFTDVAFSMGVQDAAGDGAGVAIADFNNDGYQDIFLANCSGDVLFKNNSGTSFTDITATSGLDASGPSRGTSASWGDYDNDGNLDLYVSQHIPVDVDAPGATQQDYLFYNNGNETFTNVSGHFNINDLLGYGFIGGWTDIDLDNDLDLVLINDCPFFPPDEPGNFTGTLIFRNDGGTDPISDWTFTEISATALPPSTCDHGMGLAIGDYDRDGDFDLFYTDIGEVSLYRNNGGTFSNETAAADVDGQDPQHYSWGCSFFDYNLDGFQDIVVAFGALQMPSSTDNWKNQLFENDGDGTFTDVGPTTGMDDSTKTRNNIFGDYDNDGDPDVFVINYGEAFMLKRNDNNNGNNWLKVKLVGNDSNKDGIGSKIKLTDGDGVIQYFETRSGSNLGGGDAIDAYFGIGTATSITELEVTWPTGEVQTVSNVAINQTEEVVEDVPLPVELINFTGKSREHDILLEWATAIEINNDHFKLQKSLDGRDFENIATVFGNGTTNSPSYYEHVDQNPFGGENYYRLEQFDKDGQSSYSPVILVRFPVLDPAVAVIPNPVNDGKINVRYNAPDDEVSLELFNILGKRFYGETIDNDGNVYTKTINASNLAPGIYLVRISGLFGQQTTKVLVR